jgi:uncharacterized NAD-dependent epimerase/dehydratase family protein
VSGTTPFNSITIEPPYLVFVGDTEDKLLAKTGFGIVQWRRERCLGQFRFDDAGVDLGLPEMKIDEAARNGARSLVVGVANVGGYYPESWREALIEAVGAGLDVVAGMHTRLRDVPGLAEAANRAGARLVDVRVPPSKLPVGTGRKRSGKRLLTVGTDCAAGKKYTALALEREMLERGLDATFRATGQTGIMIAGSGIPIDAVVADFVSGAAESLSPDNDPDHWDLIEGQGSLHHPAYAGVSLGLLHGSQPDAIVVCHEVGRTEIDFWEDFPVPSIGHCMETVLQMGRLTNPDIRCVGVSLNTSHVAPDRREEHLREVTSQTGLPCVDPLVDGVGLIADLLQEWRS